jgi:hypothetical protein
MTLVLRTFRSKHGCERTVVASLRNAATQMIQDRQAEAVLICQRSDILSRILWIENRARGVDLGPPAREQEASQGFEEISTPCRLIFLDGFYRFPLAPCHVWWLESHQPSHLQPELLQGLLDVARRAATDAQVVGISLYRAADDLTRVIGFLALTPGITPAEYFKEQSPFTSGGDSVARAVAWYPLIITWTGGRISADARAPISSCRYPRTAFWARSGSHVRSVVTPATAQPTNPKEV